MTTLTGKRVLLLEDEFFLADEIEIALQEAGAIVVGPYASVSDVGAFPDVNPDLAILNIRVRDGLTYPLAQHIQALGIPLIFATGHDVQSEPARWRDVPRLCKPFSPTELLKLASETIGSQRREQVPVLKNEVA